MHLKQFSVKNFKPFEDAIFTLPDTGVVVLVGPNNSGKTALLSVFDLLRVGSLEASCRRLGSKEPTEVRARFQLSSEERRQLLQGKAVMDIDAWLASQVFRELEFVYSDADGPMLETQLNASAVNDSLALVCELKGRPGQRQYLQSDLLKMLQEQKPSDVTTFKILSQSSGSLSDQHLRNQTPAPLHGLLQTWIQHTFHFRSLRPGTARKSALSSSGVLDPSGANLPQALLYLGTNARKKWEEICRIMQDVLPEVGELETPTSGSEMNVSFRDPVIGQLQNLKDLGSGVEQLLLTTFVGICQPPGSVIVIEELETNLHPAAQRCLYEYIHRWASDKLFIVSSHSSVLLDRATAGESRIWSVERSKDRSQLRQVDGDLKSIAVGLGVRHSDVLSAQRVLLLEGSTDLGILEVWFPRLRSRAHVAIVPAGGGDWVWHMETLGKAFEAADTLGRKLLFIRDRDEMSPSAVAKLQIMKGVHLLERRELENYLLDTQAIVSCLRRLRASAGTSGPIPSEAELAERISTYTKTLKPLVILKKVAAQLSSLRLVSRDDLRQIVTPDLAALRALVIRNHDRGRDTVARIDQLWSTAAQEVEMNWEKSWIELAPGEEILAEIWRGAGFKYDKRRDGVALASAMNEPPHEFVTLFNKFFAE